jgi:DNA-binding LytR/AlgR family response regulator
MKSFTIRFAEQIAANEQFSRSVTERLETTVAQLTKFRSDMAIRLETSNKEIVKVGGEIRAVEKQQIAFVASISTIVEVITAVSACQLSF